MATSQHCPLPAKGHNGSPGGPSPGGQAYVRGRGRQILVGRASCLANMCLCARVHVSACAGMYVGVCVCVGWAWASGRPPLPRDEAPGSLLWEVGWSWVR